MKAAGTSSNRKPTARNLKPARAVAARSITPKQQRFVEEYLIDLNATRAYRDAGYAGGDNVCAVEGCKLLTNPKIAAAVSAAMRRRSERVEITADMVLARWWQIATADPNHLIQLRRVGCRQCHGIDHQYQWRDQAEFQADLKVAAASDLPLPTDAGGYGFNDYLDPNLNCPHCHGHGLEKIHAADTRKLAPSALALYAGVKQTQSGFEIKMQDQSKALDNVARHLGMYKDKLDVQHGGGVTVEIVRLGE